jgi:hypothetical protein
LSHFCRTCKRYHKQDSSVVKTVSKDSQQRNQRFQRFYTYRGKLHYKAQQPSTYDEESQAHPSRERGHNKPFTPCPAGYMGDTLPHAVRVGITRTKQKGVFMHPTPVILPKNGPPTLSKPQKIFQFQKEPFKQLGSMLYLAQERWSQKWTI